MNSEIAFVAMAAGIGRRYEGTKQLETFGKAGLTIAEYNMLHALDAGFTKFYFIVSEQLAEAFHRRLKNFLPGNCAFGLIYQKKEHELAKFSPRTKPWGTAHAVMCCASAVDCNFCVSNADDLYGRDAIFRAAEFLKSAATNAKAFANVAYKLSETLSESGAVSRGVMAVDKNSCLKSIGEVHRLSVDGVNTLKISKNSLVSMNLWCFTPKVFGLLKASWNEFKKNISNVSDDEFGLPFFANAAIGNGKCSVNVLQTTSKWYGVTYRADDKSMEKALEE
ncbi:MAG: hypothetical protein LBI61_00195 [Puniceicoccales bacterium]|nr:hypothetical protein [Puniceicoccales bacterium]